MNTSDGAALETATDSFRVMVVDDSAIIRGFLSRYLNEDPEIEVIVTANNGRVALRNLERYDVEVVVLDIEMPEMDGMTALPQMIEMKPDTQIVMASTLTRKNAEISLKAVQMGAVDYVPKPETARNVNASVDFRRDLVEKVKAWATRRRMKRNEPLPTVKKATASGAAGAGFVSAGRTASASVSASRPTPGALKLSKQNAAAQGDKASAALTTRRATNTRPRILAVGSSTGGPQALMKFFEGFKQSPSVPIVVTQHMPAQFTAILAGHLGQSTGWASEEAKEGMVLKPGKIHIAPGGSHLELVDQGGEIVCHLSDAPPVNFCKPAVDPMLKSLEGIYGDRVLVVILTGMGHDGLKGSRDLAKLGANVMAQDEATSVVWGMPGAVANAGLCTDILPINDLGQAAYRRLEGLN